MISAKYTLKGYGIDISEKLLNPFVPLSKAGDVKFYAPKEIQANFENAGFQISGFKRAGQIQLHIFRK